MKSSRYIFICLCLVFCFTALSQGGETAKRELYGKIYTVGENDEDLACQNTTIRIEESDDSDVSTSTGSFRLFLKDRFKTDSFITLKVEKDGYQIWQPLAGRLRIPADLEGCIEIVRLDKLGSHRFMSNQAFSLLIEKFANAPKNMTKPDETEKPDLSRYLKDWAVKYGFGFEQVKAEMDKWAADIEKRQDNLYELGLAAFYQKNFREADEKFTESARENEEKLSKLREKEKKLKENIIRDWRLAGDSRYNDLRFQDALEAYEKALAEIDKKQEPETWASVMNDICNTYWNLGLRAEGQAARQYLANAVKGYQENLQIYTLETLPQDWAMTQNNLGITLQEQGIRTGGKREQNCFLRLLRLTGLL
ncbi:tetratricopeptide repeat-containing [Desulfonema limicola]|uniref:Tetratricopeptide repeat-containing n=1 Tax=Desulfonema limicola TaxID=45656 RepID=A0A975GFN8_9BACT|nr:hypothetical protein [Desulfonema limicola]QTA79452.1 tetratricopeptide repeat-containing [Desulfonema limicola]